jgi:hypothetical protein
VSILSELNPPLAPTVFHDTGRGTGVKLGGSLLGLAAVEFVAALHRLSVAGLPVPVDGDIPRPVSHALRQRVDQGIVHLPDTGYTNMQGYVCHL